MSERQKELASCETNAQQRLTKSESNSRFLVQRQPYILVFSLAGWLDLYGRPPCNLKIVLGPAKSVLRQVFDVELLPHAFRVLCLQGHGHGGGDLRQRLGFWSSGAGKLISAGFRKTLGGFHMRRIKSAAVLVTLTRFHCDLSHAIQPSRDGLGMPSRNLRCYSCDQKKPKTQCNAHRCRHLLGDKGAA